MIFSLGKFVRKIDFFTIHYIFLSEEVWMLIWLFHLKVTLASLGFAVKVYDDLKYGEVYDVLSEAADDDHTDHSCLVVAVMSHGDEGVIYAKDHSYKPEQLWTPFAGDKCATLVGKPKLFFIQVGRTKRNI